MNIDFELLKYIKSIFKILIQRSFNWQYQNI